MYRVQAPSSRDPRKSRVFVVVSRQPVIDSKFSTVICAPVYTKYLGLTTQVAVDTDHGLKHESAIHCDELVSIAKSMLTDYVGALPKTKLGELNKALLYALALEETRA